MNSTEAQAEKVLKAAISKAKVIMDEGANLKLINRMVGALLGSADIALKMTFIGK